MNDKKLISNFPLKGVTWILFLILSSFAFTVNAQQKNVRGTVADSNGEPIIGASVRNSLEEKTHTMVSQLSH